MWIDLFPVFFGRRSVEGKSLTFEMFTTRTTLHGFGGVEGDLEFAGFVSKDVTNSVRVGTDNVPDFTGQVEVDRGYVF